MKQTAYARSSGALATHFEGSGKLGLSERFGTALGRLEMSRRKSCQPLGGTVLRWLHMELEEQMHTAAIMWLWGINNESYGWQ